jgi:protein involved in polysaccharide export with SLBB domain
MLKLLICTIVVGMAALPLRAEDAKKNSEEKERTVQVGEPLAVTVFDLEGPGRKTEVKVEPDGKGQVALPYLKKPVEAKGLTAGKLKDAIVKAYRDENLIAEAAVLVQFWDEVEPPAGAAAARKKPAEKGSPIQGDDRLAISISDLAGPGVRTDVTLKPDHRGDVSLPYLKKPVAAKGLTCSQLEAAVARAYRDEKLLDKAQVSVKFADATEKERKKEGP